MRNIKTIAVELMDPIEIDELESIKIEETGLKSKFESEKSEDKPVTVKIEKEEVVRSEFGMMFQRNDYNFKFSSFVNMKTVDENFPTKEI